MADEEGMEHWRSRELYHCPAIVDLSTRMHALKSKTWERVRCCRGSIASGLN